MNIDENQELLEKYTVYLQVERFYSANTIENYQRDVTAFLKYIKRDLKQITENDIQKYLQYLHKNYAENTVLRKYSSLKNCFKYLYSERLINNYPCSNIKVRKKTKKIPEFIDNKQINQLLKSIEIKDHFSARDQVILDILYATGIRVSELIEIKIKDIDFNEQFIKVTGKGDKERFVPFDHITKTDIINYLEKYRSKFGTNSEWLIVNHHNRQLTRQGCYKIIKKHGEKVGIKKLTPHMFRHSVATHLLNQGMDLKFVQELLGHENITTTQIYTHTAKRKIKEEYSRHHRLGGNNNENI